MAKGKRDKVPKGAVIIEGKIETVTVAVTTKRPVPGVRYSSDEIGTPFVTLRLDRPFSYVVEEGETEFGTIANLVEEVSKPLREKVNEMAEELHRAHIEAAQAKAIEGVDEETIL